MDAAPKTASLYLRLYYAISPIYMLYYIGDHLWASRHYLTSRWAPVAIFVVGIVIATNLIYRVKRKSMSLRKWDAIGVIVCLVMSAVLWLWNHDGNQNHDGSQIPHVIWTRVSLLSPGTDDLGFMDRVTKGIIPSEELMKAPDRQRLINLRKGNGYQDRDDALNGANHRIFESDLISRCPQAVAVRPEFDAYVGVYVIRDGHTPDLRLTAVDSRVELPQCSEPASEFRVVVVFFALTAAVDQQMADELFKPEAKLDLIWGQ